MDFQYAPRPAPPRREIPWTMIAIGGAIVLAYFMMRRSGPSASAPSVTAGGTGGAIPDPIATDPNLARWLEGSGYTKWDEEAQKAYAQWCGNAYGYGTTGLQTRSDQLRVAKCNQMQILRNDSI
eukprot:tig00021728_g23298.t1